MTDDFGEAGAPGGIGAVALRSEENDDALVRAVISGETWAERELFERFAPLVHGTLRRCLGRHHDFDDLMQEVFLRVFDRLRTLRDVSALRSFVYSISVRVARSEIRRWRARRRSDATDVDQLDDQPAHNVDPETRNLLTRVERILEGMKPKHRLAFVLRHLDGQSVAEIAEELEISVATANRWLHRATCHIEKEVGRDQRLAGLLERERPAR